MTTKFSNISLFVLWISWDGLIGSEERYPAIPEEGLPVVSLTDVEDVNLNQVIYDTNGVAREMQNHFTEKTSILFPNQYILRQQFIIPQSREQPASNYRPTIHSRKYEALTAGIAEDLVDALREEEHSSERFTEKTIHEFEEVWLLEHIKSVRIVARNGKVVYDIYYEGNHSSEIINERLKELARHESM